MSHTKKKKRNKSYTSLFILMPVVIAFLAMIFKAVWLIPAVGISMFLIVWRVPVCKRHENLWIFILTAISAVPANWLLLTRFPVLEYYLSANSNVILSKLSILENILTFMGVEQIVFGLIARFIWRKQYRLYIPVEIEEED